MQLNILIALTILLLTLHSNAYCKNMKSKYTSQLNAISDKKITNLATSTSTSSVKSEANSDTKKSEQFYGEKFNYNYVQTLGLFKQTAKNLFPEKEPGMIDHCLDMITHNLSNPEAVFKSFWIKMGEIYEEQQMKARMESNPSTASPQNGSFNKIHDWKNILTGEFQDIIKYVNFEDRLKGQCSKLFSDTPRNFFDLLFILSDQKYFGGRFLLVNKNDQFIDSMFSVHRDLLPENAFKKLNEVSAGYMQFNNDQLRNIMNKRSYVPPVGNGKKESPYASNNNFDFSKVITTKNTNVLESSLRTQDKHLYTLISFGDIGNIEFFSKNSFANQGNKRPTPEDIQKWYDQYLINENYDISNLGCKVTLNDHATNKTVSVTDLEKKEGLEHFNTMLKNQQVGKLLSEANGFVLLGDMIYTEQKFLTKSKKDDVGVMLDYMDKWKQRLECGWNLFYKSLQSVGMMKITSAGNLRFGNENNKNNFYLYDNAELLAGNHSFDVDVYDEEKYVKALSSFSKENPYLSMEKETFGAAANKNLVFSYTPKFITITYQDFKIQFLDFNSQIISCLKADEAGYKECNKWNPSVIPFNDAVEYGKRFAEALDKFQQDSESFKIWRVMRAHHPPLNSEDGDSTFYFTPIPLGSGKTLNVFEVMKTKKVNLFLGSHIHNAQVLAYPYSRVYKAPEASCAEPKVERWGCFKAEPNVYTKNPTYQSTCENNLVYNLYVKDRTDAAQTNDMLYIFITGNSGRLYDSLREGKKTDGVLLWSRATQNSPKNYNYGFSYYRFSKFQVEVEFYEVADEGRVLNKGATFVVKEGKLPDIKAMENFMNNKCASS